MSISIVFIINSILLGIGLAMDAFSVSLANGLNEPYMRKKKTCIIAGTFAFFQGIMPMLGWICIHTIVQYFKSFEKCIPWIALILLFYIGGKMLIEGSKNDEDTEENTRLGKFDLLIQGIATSIDALSVGFTISEYGFIMALICALIIAVVTFIICIIGLRLGKKFGTKLAGKANILGGIILICIALEIFIKGVV